MDEFNPYWLFVYTLAMGSLGGLAAVLRPTNKRRMSCRVILSSCLNSGILGAGVGMLWYEYVGARHPVVMLATAGVIGLGGTQLVDQILVAVTVGFRNLILIYAESLAKKLPKPKLPDDDTATDEPAAEEGVAN